MLLLLLLLLLQPRLRCRGASPLRDLPDALHLYNYFALLPLRLLLLLLLLKCMSA